MKLTKGAWLYGEENDKVYLRQVQGSGESWVLVLSAREGRAKRVSGPRKMLEREDKPWSGRGTGP